MIEPIEDAILVKDEEPEMTQEEFESSMIEDRQKQYEEMIQRIMREGNMSRRNAKRFIERRSKKMLANFKKQALRNANKEKFLFTADDTIPV